MKVMVGGTFDPLHDGHKHLLKRSFEVAGADGHVVIGLTSDSFASRKNHPVRPFTLRQEELERFISSTIPSTHWDVEPLNDRYGSALDADFDALIVSEETLPAAIEINKIRREKGKKKVDIHQISCVLAEDGRWISSTRIYRREIDVHGHLLQ
jgi:pantetheine-phosphate adenylyltransferase